MNKVIFDEKDLNVFTIDGLEARMEGLDTYVRPKFRALAEHFVPYLSETQLLCVAESLLVESLDLFQSFVSDSELIIYRLYGVNL